MVTKILDGHSNGLPQPMAADYNDDIAIIGMSCKAPGDATSPEKLWRLCVEGRNAWSEIPEHRFSQAAFFHPQGEHPGRVSGVLCKNPVELAIAKVYIVERLGSAFSG
jgi:hypothetical protein